MIMESIADLRKLDVPALQEKVKLTREALAKLSVAHALESLKNPRKITEHRRFIARLLTLIAAHKA
jgi:ribosomal protein L29